MATHYRKITNGAEPSSPSLGEMWVNQAGESYQMYIWINRWYPLIGGGAYISESGADSNYVNVVIQEDIPYSIIKPCWFWIKESTNSVYIYLWDFIPIVSV